MKTRLDDRDHRILALRGQGLSLREIGKRVGLSGERVRQLIKRADEAPDRTGTSNEELPLKPQIETARAAVEKKQERVDALFAASVKLAAPTLREYLAATEEDRVRIHSAAPDHSEKLFADLVEHGMPDNNPEGIAWPPDNPSPPGLVRALREARHELEALKQTLSELEARAEAELGCLVKEFRDMSLSERMELYRRKPDRWRRAMDALAEREVDRRYVETMFSQDPVQEGAA